VAAVVTVVIAAVVGVAAVLVCVAAVVVFDATAEVTCDGEAALLLVDPPVLLS